MKKSLKRFFVCAHRNSEPALNSAQPHPQGLLGVQNGRLEKTLANSRLRDLKLANHKARADLQYFWRHETC